VGYDTYPPSKQNDYEPREGPSAVAREPPYEE
jgi:hypothetical protein